MARVITQAEIGVIAGVTVYDMPEKAYHKIMKSEIISRNSWLGLIIFPLGLEGFNNNILRGLKPHLQYEQPEFPPLNLNL